MWAAWFLGCVPLDEKDIKRIAIAIVDEQERRGEISKSSTSNVRLTANELAERLGCRGNRLPQQDRVGGEPIGSRPSPPLALPGA